MTGNTMPLTMPKAASGSAIPAQSASRLGTMRFSTVVMPVRRSSATARGRAVSNSARRMGIFFPQAGLSASRRTTSAVSVKMLPNALPSTTLMQARPASCPAQTISSPMVMAMDTACSATSTAARVPIRSAAVK